MRMKNCLAAICAFAMLPLLGGCSVADTASKEGDETRALNDTAELEDTADGAVTALTARADAPYAVDVTSLFTDRDLRSDYTVDTEIRLDGDTASIDGSGAAADGSTITITDEGVYRLTGTLDGQIVVASEGKVQLVLDGVTITNESGAAILVTGAKKTFLTLAPGSENVLADGTSRSEGQEDDAVIYSKDGLTINGSGALTVTAAYDKGIVSKDELAVTGGTLTVSSPGTGIKGKDSVAVYDGQITVEAGGDGIKADNDTDEGKGFVCICGGTCNITAAEDAIQAETELIVEGGDITVLAGGGLENAPVHAGDFGMGGGMGFGRGFDRHMTDQTDGEMPAIAEGEMPSMPDGEMPTMPEGEMPSMPEGEMPTMTEGEMPSMPDGEMPDGEMPDGEMPTMAEGEMPAMPNGEMPGMTEDTTETGEDTISTKGLKAGTLLYIGAGTVKAEAADDVLHSNGSLYITGGTCTLAAGSKGIHADETVEISGGTVDITDSHEGIEAKDILVSGGDVHVVSSDDGFNASDGSAQGAMGGAVACTLEISGGRVYVDAGGDGLDSNGALTVSGGIVLVDGPTNSGNGALDTNDSLTCTGGLLIAAGAAGMAEYPTGTQETIVMTTSAVQSAETLVTVLDAEGNEVLSYAPSKTWSSFIVSTPDLASGETYTLLLGGTSTADVTDGLYTAGGYQNDGTEEGSVTLDDTVCFIGTAGSMGGMQGGMMGGRGGFDPGSFTPGEMPTDENGESVFPGDHQGGMRGDRHGRPGEQTTKAATE